MPVGLNNYGHAFQIVVNLIHYWARTALSNSPINEKTIAIGSDTIYIRTRFLSWAVFELNYKILNKNPTKSTAVIGGDSIVTTN